MNTTLTIDDRTVGEGHPVYIIAEAGVNHNGDIALAKKLIDAAQVAGADAVKFQTFIPEELVTEQGEMAEYQERNTGSRMSQLEMLRSLALSDDEFRALAEYAKEKHITFLSTAHDGFHSVDLLASLNVPAFKFGSADTNNDPVLEYAARIGKPLILSTGMSDMQEVLHALEVVRKAGNDQIVVLQCTTDYPAHSEDTHLRAMNTMGSAGSVLVGYSDHTTGTQASVMAVARGAVMLEKHLTLDNAMQGPDHQASLNPTDFAAYVQAVREAERMLGSDEKVVTERSKIYIPLVKKSIVARRPIAEGVVITADDLAIKRPAHGLPPSQFSVIIGSRALRNIARDEFLQPGDYRVG